jgi:hypothetical protein
MPPSTDHADPDQADPDQADPDQADPDQAGADQADAGWRSYVRPAFLVLGALFLQLAFIAAYVGALHAPEAHRLPVAVISSPSVDKFQARIEQKTDEVSSRPYARSADGFRALYDQNVYAVLRAGKGSTLELHLASAGGGAAAEDLTQLYGKYAYLTGVEVDVYDDVPLPASDNRGISPFYLVVGWIVGGYLVSTLLSFIAGAHPEPRRGRIRILALLAYAIASGIGGAVIVGPVLEIWHHNLVPLAALGVLTVFGAAAASAALSALLGSVGTGVTILLLVVLGNPGSGGPFSPELLPGPFRGLHTWLLTGAATRAVRSIVYFDGRGDRDALIVLLLWCGIGAVLYLTSITVRGAMGRARLARRRPGPSGAAPAPAIAGASAVDNGPAGNGAGGDDGAPVGGAARPRVYTESQYPGFVPRTGDRRLPT